MELPPNDPTAAMQSARTMMVDSQVRPNKVTDPLVIAAMRRLPREAFLPEALAARAYADEDVPLGGGRVMPEPMVLARLVQSAALRRGERVLVIGAGTGYGAAVIAACGADVTALEDDPNLLAIARAVLPIHAPGVRLVEGKLTEGWPSSAPYDCIFVEGAVEVLPPSIGAQIASHGRLLMVRSQGGRMSQAVIGRMGGVGLNFAVIFDCAVPLLPSMRQVPAFVF